jgi:hypothetical protein
MQGDFVLPDSDEIVKYLEKEHPEHSMDSSVPGDVTAGFFPAFRGLLMCKPEELAAKKDAFIAEAKKVWGRVVEEWGDPCWVCSGAGHRQCVGCQCSGGHPPCAAAVTHGLHAPAPTDSLTQHTLAAAGGYLSGGPQRPLLRRL